MAGLTVQTAPARKALDMDDVKNYLKLDGDQDDVFVSTLIGVASNYVENYTGRSLINRTYKLSLDGFNEIDDPLWEGVRDGADITYRKREVELPSSPVTVVSSVTTYDDNDNPNVMSSAKYYVDTASIPAKIALRDGESWDDAKRVRNSVEIVYTAGYGASPASIPEPIRLAMYQMIAFSYEHRGEYERFPPPTMPASINDLLMPYRVMHFSSSILG